MATARPLIGITCNYEPSREYPGERDVCKQHVAYYRALERAEALPVLLPAISEQHRLAEYLERLDGIIFSGALDLPPETYGKPPHPKTEVMSPQRFQFEWPLAKLAMAHRLPVLGICGGVQLLSTLMGGTLYQHIPDEIANALVHASGKHEDARHEVELAPGSRLAEIFGTRATVNSAHHQAIDKLGDGFVVVARASDGVIEAIEQPGERFLVGVQWHPERCPELPGQKEIFDAFAAACRRYRRGK